MAAEDVLFERDGRIATITLNRPEKLNALTGEMMARLQECWEEVRRDDTIWVAVITGAGERSFCSGRDLMASAPGGPEYHRIRKERGLPADDDGLDHFLPLNLWKPVIAAINGYCLAGGFALALACDIRIASENARLGTSSSRRGLVAGGGQTQRLVRYLPFGIAMELLLYSDAVEATRLQQFGLVNAVVPLESLQATAREWAERLCEMGPLALRATKEAAYRGGLEMTFAEGRRLEATRYNEMLETEDVLEGARAFAERRQPNFRAR
ncbi:MAG TPA: enoyl-CoA hydratase-related protein [Dehalococcoidia bacterium]|jgi:enoyl-CoA hydratase/carnithine racemase